MFSGLDNFVGKLMSKVFEGLSELWADLCARAGKGAYFCFLLFATFIIICTVMGIIKMSKKPIILIILVVLMVVLPIVWFFVFK